MMAFQKIDIKDLDMNVFQTIGQDWMLITAGDQQKIWNYHGHHHPRDGGGAGNLYPCGYY